MKNAHRIGAVFYVLWGIFHSYIGVFLLWKTARSGAPAALRVIGDALPSSAITTVDDRVTAGVLEHYAWNLIWFGAFAIVVALALNWKNSPVGYWFNLVVVSLTDIGFIGAIVLPGMISPAAGWTGPAFWVLAATFTTLGLSRTLHRSEAQRLPESA